MIIRRVLSGGFYAAVEMGYRDDGEARVQRKEIEEELPGAVLGAAP